MFDDRYFEYCDVNQAKQLILDELDSKGIWYKGGDDYLANFDDLAEIKTKDVTITFSALKGKVRVSISDNDSYDVVKRSRFDMLFNKILRVIEPSTKNPESLKKSAYDLLIEG